MSESIDLLLAAASQATSGTASLLEAAKTDDANGPAYELRKAETPELLCDALKITLELVGGSYPDAESNEMAGQLLAACARFLEGWA